MIAAIKILVLCTGNICRSPMAAALLRQAVAERGLDVEVDSAGLVTQGRAASESAVEVLAGRGIDLGGHVSRIMERGDVAGADLVLAMARRHLREAVVLDPRSFPHTYTLKELVRRGEALGGRRPGESVDDWLGRLHEGRSPSDHLGDHVDDDVVDPIGESFRTYQRVGAELEDLVHRAADLLWGAEVSERLPA